MCYNKDNKGDTPKERKIVMAKKLHLVEIVFSVKEMMKDRPIDIAINDAANSFASTYEEYCFIWNFLESLVW